MKKIIRNNYFVIIYLIVYFVVINLVTLNRFWQFEAYYFDHGLYDQSIWRAAHFQAPLISHHFTQKPLLQLGDHFTPAIYLLSPIYWFTRSYTPILIIHNLFLVLSAIILFLIARMFIKNKLMIFSIIFAYTGFVGMQNAIIANFHTEIPALLPISLMFYFLFQKKWKPFYFFLFFTLLFKENFAALIFSVGFFLLLSKKCRHGIFIMAFSVSYYFLVTKIVIPLLSGHPYFYSASVNFDPVLFVEKFFVPNLKIQTLFVSFTNFSFLPLFNPLFLPIIIQDYFVRFVIDGAPSRIDLGLHYNAIPALLMAISSIIVVKNLMKLRLYKKLVNIHALLIIFTVLFLHYKLHGPLGLAYNSAFYTHTKNLNFLRSFISQIPSSNGLVMTQNNLAAQLTHTHNLMLLRSDYWNYKPDVIAIDIRGGQSANNYWPLPPNQFEDLYKNLLNDKNYRMRKITKNQIIFFRK